MKISESRRGLGRGPDTFDALPRRYGQSTSLMLCTFSRENQLIWSGVHRPERALSMSLRCDSRLNVHSSASPTTSVLRMWRLACWDASEEVEFLDVIAHLSVHAVTTDGALQARHPRNLVQVSACQKRVDSKRGGLERPGQNWMTAARSLPARMLNHEIDQ